MRVRNDKLDDLILPGAGNFERRVPGPTEA